jgi:hypothetical protein
MEKEKPDELCTGLCLGVRGVHDSPARLIPRGNGRTILVCSCCSRALVYVSADWSTGAPNIRNDLVASKQKRFECKHCKYDVVLLSELTPV